MTLRTLNRYWREGAGSGGGAADLPIGLNSIKYNSTPPSRATLEAALGFTLENYFLTEREIRFTNIGYTIPDDAFNGDTTITNLYLQAAIVGQTCFQDNTALLTVHMPLCTDWGAGAFFNCSALTVADGDIAQFIRNSCFSECDALIRVNFPVATIIEGFAFISCPALVYVNAMSVVTIGDQAFYNCIGLLEANFPAVTTIISDSFRNCTSLVTINFKSAKSFGPRIFNGCSSLLYVNLPVAAQFQAGCFLGCTSLSFISLPAAISLGLGMFHDCLSLQSATLPVCTDLGGSSADNEVFLNTPAGLVVTCPVSLRTANAGAPDGDLVYVVTNGGRINYIDGQIFGSVLVNLTAAQIRTGNTVPIRVGLPQPGAGKYLYAVSAEAKFSVGGVTAGFTSIAIGNESALNITMGKYHQLIGYGGGFSGTVDSFSGSISGAEAQAICIVANDFLAIQFDFNSLLQTGTCQVEIIYKIVTL